MNEYTKNEPPGIITIFCVVGFLGVAAGLWRLNSPDHKALGATFQVYYAVVLLPSLVALVGLWKMMKWGIVLYGVVSLVNAFVLWQVWHYSLIAMMTATAINAAIIIVVAYNFRKLN